MRRALTMAGGLLAGLLVVGLLVHGRALSKSGIVPDRARGGHDLHPQQLTRYVNPLIGTAHDGNVFPGADVPFGMVQWSPDTSAGGLTKPGGYNYGDLIIRGFSLTHLSGAGCVSFGNILFMPTTRRVTVPPQPNESPYSARFLHREEQASPGYYGVRLGSGIEARLSVTQRTGIGAFTFPTGRTGSILIDVGSGARSTSNADGPMNAAVWITGRNEVAGRATSGRFCGLPNTYTVYFAARFDRPAVTSGTWSRWSVTHGAHGAAGARSGAYLTFDTSKNRSVTAKVALSFVGVRNALANLQAENPGWSFSTVRGKAEATWNSLLNRVQVSGGTAAEEHTFYTALYHALLQPNVFSDANGQYLGFDGKAHLAKHYVQYANFSGWDIYRSEMQLLAWLAPREASDMMQSLLADAEQGGRLPKWPVANDYTGEMNGDSADPIIADAYAFGARRFDLRHTFGYMLRGASQPGKAKGGYEERPELSDYLRLGYVPPHTGGWGSAATTLEYAVDDFAIAQVTKALGDRTRYRIYLRRAQNWKHVFNAATNFVEPRTPGGLFPSSFDPTSTDGFVEGNSWQYSWMAPQNLAALFHAMGGMSRVTSRLDRLFTRLNAGPAAPYYWGGNEPGLEIPWEYDFAGKPWRTQAVVREIETSLFNPTATGLPGNDDLGAMSSWYVWAAIGLYPEIPGVGGLVVGSPLFPTITVSWGRGNRLRITAPGASPSRPYVHGLRLKGRSYSRTWLPLSGIMGLTTLSFELTSKPSTAWGSRAADLPPSFAGS